MAQVDFSNAVLDVKSGSTPLTNGSVLGFTTNTTLFDASGTVITTNHSQTTLVSTSSKVSILYTGQFTTSGTECYPGNIYMRVSNISFSAGDTYSFVIDVEVTGNT